MNPKPDNDINGLLLLLSERKTNGCYFDQRYHAALTALVAERDALKQRVEKLEALSKPLYITHGQRVESIDLRERLVESALRVAHDTMMTESEAEKLGRQTVWIVNGALAAMRKGESDGK